jgi:LTXXQ motif family protein
MNKKPLFFSVVAVGLALGLTHAAAQQRGAGSGMMGPGMIDRDSPMGRGGMMGMMMGGCPMMGADGQASTFIDGRLAFLKAELAITDAQKAAWDTYADATKGNLESMRGMWQTMRTVLDAKTPVERLDAHLAAMESRIKVLQEVKPTLAKLYEALSAEQKKKADEILTGMGCMM